jgi:hypothetical protein
MNPALGFLRQSSSTDRPAGRSASPARAEEPLKEVEEVRPSERVLAELFQLGLMLGGLCLGVLVLAALVIVLGELFFSRV